LEALRSSALYPDAHYVFECRYDLNALEPMVAQPHRVGNVAPVSAVRGRPVHQAWLGTCANSQLGDIAAACALRACFVRGVTGGDAAGLRRDEADGVVGTPGCGACMGNHMGAPATGEVTISNANRNFRGCLRR